MVLAATIPVDRLEVHAVEIRLATGCSALVTPLLPFASHSRIGWGFTICTAVRQTSVSSPGAWTGRDERNG